MENAYTADVPVAIGGRDYLLRYDFKALAAINTAYPGRDPITLLAYAMSAFDGAAFMCLLLAGLQRHHKADLTEEQINEAMPPLAIAGEAIKRALIYTAFGPDGPPKEEPQADPQQPAASPATS